MGCLAREGGTELGRQVSTSAAGGTGVLAPPALRAALLPAGLQGAPAALAPGWVLCCRSFRPWVLCMSSRWTEGKAVYSFVGIDTRRPRFRCSCMDGLPRRFRTLPLQARKKLNIPAAWALPLPGKRRQLRALIPSRAGIEGCACTS